MSSKKHKTVTVYTRVEENPGVFHIDNGLLFCNYCDRSIEWKHKSTVDAHCMGKKHRTQKRNYEDNQKRKNQQTLETTFLAANSKREMIEDLIQSFACADIPLEKINFL